MDESEEQRRYKIYLQINDQDPYGVGKLTSSQYMTLKHNDKAVHDFVWQLYESKKISIVGGKINTILRSIDDLDYTPVKLPEETQTSCFTQAPQSTAGSCSAVTAGKNDEPELSANSRLQSELASNESSMQSKSVGPATNDNEVPDLQLVRNTQALRSRKPSEVWKHFQKESESTARCIICNKIFKHSGNTTNLTQHMNRKHSLLCPSVGERKRSYESSNESSSESADNPSEVKRMKLKSKGNRFCPIDEAFERVTSFADGGKTSDKITNAILYMVAVDQMPFSTVEHEGFKTLMKTVAPLYSIPSRRTLTKLIDSRYDVIKERCKINLQKVHSYSLTCDVWTDVGNQSYLGVSIHHLSENLKMKNRCLGVVPLHENHTAVYLAKSLNLVIDDFKLDRAKIMAIVSDNGANIKKAVLDTVGSEKHLSCFAHILSHLVSDVLPTMPTLTIIITKVKTIVTSTRRSVVASDELKRLQIRDGKSEGTALKFIQDVATRWNSTFYMLERFLLLEEYVYPVLLKGTNSPDMLKREEIQILKEVVQLMKPLENVIKEISGDTYPTCSIIIPIVRCMEAAIQQITPATELAMEFKLKLQEAIECRFRHFEANSILAISTILDPRFKKMHFESALAASTAIFNITDKIKKTLPKKSRSEENEVNGKKDSVQTIWEFHDSLMSKKSDTGTHDESTNLEVRQYLSQPVIPRTKNPFVHWKTLEHAFPALFKIAMRYLCVVGTSVPSERLFSKAGLIKTETRNRLSGAGYQVIGDQNYQFSSRFK